MPAPSHVIVICKHTWLVNADSVCKLADWHQMPCPRLGLRSKLLAGTLTYSSRRGYTTHLHAKP